MILAALILQAPPAALSPKAFQARCAEFSQAKDWKGLEGAARAQLTAAPKDAAAYSALGYALFAQNKTEEGRAACERAISLDPKQTSAYLYLGLAYAQSKDSAGIIKTGQRLSTAQPFAIDNYYKVPAIFESARELPSEPIDIEPVPHPQISPGTQVPYPVEAVFHHIQGTVALDVEVAEDGTPSLLGVLAGPKELVPAATATLKGFRYRPMVKDGYPTKFRTPAFFHFRLD